jgi:tRNA-specific 2-thiouridylase
VLRVLREQNAVVVGPAEQLLRKELHAADVAWQGPHPARPFEAQVRIRYRHEPAPALVTPTPEGFHVEFTHAQRAVAPGQAAVVYSQSSQSHVVGGGFICEQSPRTSQ